MITAEHISKRFGSFSVLEDVTLQAEKSEVYGLIGYNGAGKTTLMKILCGIYRPDSGNVWIDGNPVFENLHIKRQSFFMTEESAFFPQSSLQQMRKFYQGYYPGWRDKTFYGLARWSGMDLSKKIGRFSKGMQRKAGLILALSSDARYLFLDEAFDGLDAAIRRQVRSLLKYYAVHKDACVLVSSHNLLELEDLADSIGMLSDGSLVFDGKMEDMKKNYQTCRFLPGEDPRGLDGLQAEFLEKEPSGCVCVIQASEEEARKRLEGIHARQIQIRPVGLEEFFQKGKGEQEVDWSEIFE